MRRSPKLATFALLGGLAGLLAGPGVQAGDGAPELRPGPTSRIDGQNWGLRLPAEERVEFRGRARFDEAGLGMQAMMYPAPGLAGLVAAVVTHGVMTDVARKSQKLQLQDEADRVLAPYRPALATFRYRELMARAADGLNAEGATHRLVEPSAPAEEASIECTPVFTLTPDRTALILDCVAAIYPPGPPAEAVFRNPVRMVSAPVKSETGLEEYWGANEAAKLKEEGARLLADTLKLVLAEAAGEIGGPAAPFRTLRYREGDAERMERAQLLSEQCGRIVMRTLRGALMSVPASRGQAGDPSSCGAESPRAR